MTVVGDLKAVLDGLVSDRVYRDLAPKRATFPHVTISDDGAASALRGDGRMNEKRELVTVHLWERAEDEDDALAVSVVDALNGLKLDTTEGRHRLTVDGWVRLPPDPLDIERIVHKAMSVRSSAAA